MKIAILSFFFSFSLYAANDSLITGQMNGVDINLKITTSTEQTHIVGNFSDKKTDLTVTTKDQEADIEGLINGRSISLHSHSHSSEGTHLIEGQYNDRKALLTIESNTSAHRFSGLLNGNNLSTFIKKDIEGITQISGFYQQDLADLKIFRDKEITYFDGYICGYWSDLTINSSGKEYLLSGHIKGKPINLTVTKSDFPLNHLIELIIFDFYIPQINLLFL